MKTGLLENLLGASLVVLIGVSALAQQANEPQCRIREVIVLAKSTPQVHLNEKDEGRVISRYTVKDCGTHIVIDPATRVDIPAASAGVRVCPPNVQDCIAP